jgi:ADP-ribose pyrophosphatase
MPTETLPRILETRTAYNGRIFDATIERIQPAARERPLEVEVVRHAPSVGLAATPTADSIMLVRQYRHAARAWLWELPAGSVDAEETAEDAARRECHEELGLVAGELEDLGTLIPLPGYCSEQMTFFRITNLRPPRPDDPEAHQDEDEDIVAGTFALSEVQAMIQRREIRDMKTVAVLALLNFP